jgi:tetratricopeptide (TPR) repeat protein
MMAANVMPGPARNARAGLMALFVGLLLGCAAVRAAETPGHTPAEPRFALVIGNSGYSGAPLANAANDAQAVAKVLQRAGFEVDLKLNANQRQMQDAIASLGRRLNKDGVGLFYFAGHGVQIRGRNYLVPVGAEIRREADVPTFAVDVQQMLDRMGGARNRTNVVILDACRDNPFAGNGKAGAGGLSQLDAPTGSLIAFATAPGAVASDGKGANGLYTQHLLANIERPGTPIEEVFKRVRLGVRLDSNGGQIPWESTSLEADFSFFPDSAGRRTALAPTLPPPPGIELIAHAELGYDLLRRGKLDAAESEFRGLAGNAHPDVSLMGREGLAEVMLTRGNVLAAIAEANDIIAKSPGRSAAYLIRGRALAASGNAQEGGAAIQLAAGPQTNADFGWQKSSALVAAGNQQRKADPAAAAKTYEKAVRENPKSVEALSNLAVALNESGDARRSGEVLEKALTLDPNDAMTVALLRQVRESLAERDDRARQAAIDDSVKELSARFRSPAGKAGAAAVDDWTSPVLALTVLPFQDNTLASLTGRIGMEGLLQQALIQELQARGLPIVERRLLDKVMAEVRLGSSELVDQDTQIRLGKVFAARLMISGAMNNDGNTVSVGMRAIDTETTRLALVRSERAAEPLKVDALAKSMADAVARTVKEKYPLKGRVVAMDGPRAILNLGRKHGVMAGQSFNVLSRGEPIESNGRVLGYKDTRVARLTVTEVDDLLSYAKVDESSAAIEKQQRVIVRSE